jgi:hypothetical protein
MNTPDWYKIMEQWIDQGMGESGVTLPFIVGAISLKHDHYRKEHTTVGQLLTDITECPINTHLVEASWCSTIGSPVLNVKEAWSQEKMLSPLNIRHRMLGHITLAFSYNLVLMMGGESALDMLARLERDAAMHADNRRFSRNRIPGTNNFEYGPFTSKDISFIRNTLKY